MTPSPDLRNSRVDENLQRLFVLRNITIAGELIAILLVTTGLDLQLPLLQLGLILLALVILNLFTFARLHRQSTASFHELAAQLVLDVIAFTLFLYLTGGATNPFAWYYLMPLVISATLLPARYTWSMAALTIACYSALMFYHIPLSYGGEHAGHTMNPAGGFSQHIFGMWFGFVLSALLVAWFIVGMANTLRERDHHLAAAREKALKDERLVALGTLAAGAAHELGTPLGTMAIVTHELAQDYPAREYRELHDKLELLDGQLQRCKEALSVMSATAGEQRAIAGYPVPARDYLAGVIDDWRQRHPDIRVDCNMENIGTDGQIVADQTITQSLGNILNNAADASPEHVDVAIDQHGDQLDITIADRGQDWTAEQQRRAGQHIFSTKEQGMGVGLLLAHASIERLGGEIRHLQREGGGTCTHITLPLIRPQTPAEPA